MDHLSVHAVPESNHGFVHCPLCYSKFIPVSLKIHYSQCLAKQKPISPKKPYKVPENVQYLIATHPTFEFSSKSDILDWNEQAKQVFENVSLVACKNCNRKFLPDRLVVHARSCGSTDRFKKGVVTVGLNFGESAKKSAGNAVPEDQGNNMTKCKPVGIDNFPQCPICKRKFTFASIPIHLKQCALKNHVNECEIPKILEKLKYDHDNKVKEDKLTGKDKDELLEFISNKIDQVDLESYDAFKNDLKACPMCDRKFSSDRIEKHLSICKGVSIKKKVK